MALRRPLTQALTCSNCQRWILRSFIAAVGGQPISNRGVNPLHEQQQRRTFSRTAGRSNEDEERIAEQPHTLNEINESVAQHASPLAQSPPISTPPQEQDTNLPWYLRVQPPLTNSSPIPSREILPDLPPNPPPLLQPLVTHISDALGMDNLTLLDLRALDPPPALGSNLLMLIGTARSERHLHVSADKLCRWLRTEHKLSPYADGLLGRGELKILMRRKAKRRRLMSAVNAAGSKGTGEGEVEEGVRTGWVCVNLGRVPGSEGEGRDVAVEVEGERDGVIGFGRGVEGRGKACNIVVQLMTEEKRAEVELERLWEGLLAKAERERASLEPLDEIDNERVDLYAVSDSAAVEVEDNIKDESYESTTMRNTLHPTSTSATSTTSSPQQQIRAYHTSTRRSMLVVPLANTAVNVAEASKEEAKLTFRHANAVTETPALKDDPSLATFDSLLTELKAMPRNLALESLGPNLLQAAEHLSLDTSPPMNESTDAITAPSTPWLSNFYAHIPTFPTPAHWHAHVSLLAHARTLGHPAMHSPVLVAQVKNMLLAGAVPEERTYRLVVRAMLTPLGATERRIGEVAPSNNKVRDVLSVLEDMETCGYAGGEAWGEVLDILYKACVSEEDRATPTLGQNMDLKNMIPPFQLARLRRLANATDWHNFWRTWRSYPQRFLPRSAAMYNILFSAIAEGKLLDPPTEREATSAENAGKGKVEALREAQEIVRASLEDMEMEEPEVRVEDDVKLAEAVRGALEWVEPGLRRNEGEGVAREWRGWYARCLRVLEGRG